MSKESVKILTHCIGCGVLKEVVFSDEIWKTKDINDVIEVEKCSECNCMFYKVVDFYIEEPEYFVSDKGEWFEGQFEHWFNEKRQKWCYMTGHFRNDDSEYQILRRRK